MPKLGTEFMIHGNRVSDTSAPGWLGGIAGVGLYVFPGDIIICNKTTVGGGFAAVGRNWNLQRAISSELFVLDENLDVKTRIL